MIAGVWTVCISTAQPNSAKFRCRGDVAREADVDELDEAVVAHRPVYRAGRRGAATLEGWLSMLESEPKRKNVFLSHPVPSFE